MKVDRVSVHVEPWHYTDHVVLRAEVTADGRDLYYQQVYRPDDLESMFDRLVREAFQHLKNVLIEVKEKA